ncbi:glycosyltransferase [Candidatus Pacearchaeota archaeon]|nr:glycosyltransferase [Candidatus Pacearchaeota archaeon]
MKKKKSFVSYGIRDLSVIIPTYNRPDDIALTLSSLRKFPVKEVIVVDQSKDDRTKRVVKSIKNITYLYSSQPSITIARNKGAKASSGRLVCFIDDDVTLGKNYFSEILKVFNENPDARAAAAYIKEDAKDSPFMILLKKLFFLSRRENERTDVVSSYGNLYPIHLAKTKNTQWLPGVNMVYKREVFSEQQFDENLLGYTVVEDMDFSYRLYMRHHSSLFLTPYADIVHRASSIERYPTRKISYLNQVDHFYFNFKDMNKGILQQFKFIWSLLGITLLRKISALTSGKKENILRLTFYLSSLIYCFTHLGQIRKGRVRNFQ